MVANPEDSTPLIPKLDIGHDFKPVLFTFILKTNVSMISLNITFIFFRAIQMDAFEEDFPSKFWMHSLSPIADY
jgi:hypothetical protein